MTDKKVEKKEVTNKSTALTLEERAILANAEIVKVLAKYSLKILVQQPIIQLADINEPEDVKMPKPNA